MHKTAPIQIKVYLLDIPRQPTCMKLYRYWGIVSAYTIRCSAQIGQHEPCSLGISNKSVAVPRQDSIRPCRAHAVLSGHCNMYMHVHPVCACTCTGIRTHCMLHSY